VVTTGALGWLVLLAAFAFSRIYLVSLVILCMVGTMQIVFTSMSQSIVQAWAPQNVRGRVMGVYNFATGGTRVISGVILGSVATQLGVAPTLLLLVGMIALIVLGTSSVVRSTWQFEMKEGTFSATEGRVPVS
jgi:MFS family permease